MGRSKIQKVYLPDFMLYFKVPFIGTTWSIWKCLSYVTPGQTLLVNIKTHESTYQNLVDVNNVSYSHGVLSGRISVKFLPVFSQ